MLTLRRATIEDADFLLMVRNDPLTRRQSRTTHEIAREEHRAWLLKVLGACDRRLYVAEYTGSIDYYARTDRYDRRAGMGRLDDLPDGAVEVSLALAPHYRGRFLAIQLLYLLIAQAEPRRMVAEVKSTNEVSLCTFIKAGFVPQRVEGELVTLEGRRHS